MREWRLVVLLCTALLCEPVWSEDKWSRPDAVEKRVDDWIPITATCPSCQKNLESNTGSGSDEVGSLLNPPAVPSARSAFTFNPPQGHFKRAPAGEPYEITTPTPSSAQFFSQQQVPKIPQPVHFPTPFFGAQNPFQTRFPGLPNFQPIGQPQFTFLPQPQIQNLPKENKVTFPESPFAQQQNKGVQLVYVPIEALQRQKPRFQADRPVSQQTLDGKTQSSFENDKLRFQRPQQTIEPTKPRFPTPTQFEQETNRFAPPPSSFEQDTGRFPAPSQLFEQGKPSFPTQLKEQRPEFLPQNEQPVPQSYQFVEDVRNPPSNFFQFHENRFQKPSFEAEKQKESKPQVQQSFIPNFDESRQESAQNVVSNFDGNRPRPEPPQNFQETRPRQETPPPQFVSNFQKTIPRLESTTPPQFVQRFQETRPKQESSAPPQFVQNIQETRPRPEPSATPQFTQNIQETRPRQEPSASPQFIQNFQETRPRQEPSLPPQFVPNFEESKLGPQQQFIPNFEARPQQEIAEQSFVPNFETLRPNPEAPLNFLPNFQETRPKQESQEIFMQNFEEVKPKSKPKFQLPPSPIPPPQEQFSLPSSTEQIIRPPSTPYPPPHQPPLSVYMEKRLDNRVNEVLSILKDAKTIPVLDTIGDSSPKVFVGPSDLDAPRGYVKFELPYLSSLDITKIESMADRLPFFVAPLNFKPPFGYAKIPFPPPHIGSVVVSSKLPAVASSTEFIPFTLTSQLPTEVNSLQPSLQPSSTPQATERIQSTTTTQSTPKRNRQRKPIHRGSLSSFSSTTPANDITERQRDQFTTPAELQRLPESSPTANEQQFVESTPTPTRQKFSRKPVEQKPTFESTQPSIQQNQVQFDGPQQQQQQLDSPQQQPFDSPQLQQQFESPQQQFFADQQVPQTQQEYLNNFPQQTQQFFNSPQQPSQQSFFENQPQPTQQFNENPPQTVQEPSFNNPQPEVSNQELNQQQFISSSTEKQIFKNFQQVQPLSQFNAGNNILNLQQSSTEQVQSASNPPQTVSVEPQTLAPVDTQKLRQRLSYYDKLSMTSTQVPVESTSVQNAIETSEKPRERPKLRPRQRLTTTRRPITEAPTSEEISQQAVTEPSTQRYNPLKRRRLSTTTTSTTEQTETTRNPLRSRTTQSGRSDFVRPRSRRPTTTTTTTTTTSTEAPRVQQYEDVNDVRLSGNQDEQKKVDEAAAFWNDAVTIQQSHSYELDTTYTQPPSEGGRFSSAEPPAEEDFSKDKHGNEKKAHDPNSEKKGQGRRGHWVRVRVKKPQDGLDTAESQNSLGPLSANAIRELATKPTSEFGVPSSSSESTASEITTEPMPTTTASTTTTNATTTTTTTTTANPLPTTTVFDEESMTVVDDERKTETTVAAASVSSTTAKYPDDEQDEAFQRNLADMLAKFIGGGNNEPQQTTAAAAAAAVEEMTAETDMEPTVTPPAVTETPAVPVTSTTTKVSMETEICYKGRCIKSKKNKQITDLLPEP